MGYYPTVVVTVGVAFSDSYAYAVHLVDIFGEVDYVDFAECVDFFTVCVDYVGFISPSEYAEDEVEAGTVEVESFTNVGDESFFVWFWYVDV